MRKKILGIAVMAVVGVSSAASDVYKRQTSTRVKTRLNSLI